jgi:hypothetical protein
MNREYVFNVWAPPGGPWSAWVKPVLFAHVDPLAAYPDVQLYRPEQSHWVPTCDGSTGLVLDLPGVQGVSMAMVAATTGYRPIPLYNALPSPSGHNYVVARSAVCDVQPIIAALSMATPDLDKMNLRYDAPPVFLLDSQRRIGTEIHPSPGMFDNRSVSLPTDFPSASRMLSMGIKRVVLVQETAMEPQVDLSHTLLRWQQARIEIQALALSTQLGRQTITVRKPSRYGMLWQRMLATIGLRRNPLGGFGGVLPMPSAG